MKVKTLLSLAASTLLAHGLLGVETENLTPRGSFSNARLAFEKKKAGRVAFMGGSITEMNGYRPMLAKWLEERFPKTKFEFINAGISSTCSTTGAFRLHRDVLDHGPIDLFFIEFAVNDDQDAGHSKEACIRGMEGIIRQMRMKSPKTDLAVTYFVNPGMLKQLQEGKAPLPMAAHERVLEKYGVSRVHLARELAHQIKKGSFSWQKFGGTHPKEPGNRLCADMHIEMLEKAWTGKNNADLKKKKFPAKPIDGNSYFNGRFLSPAKATLADGWKFSEPDWKSLPGGKRKRYLDRPLLHSESPGKPIRIKFEGKAIGAFVSAGPDAGILEFVIDGKQKGSVDLYHHYSRGLHYPRSVMFAHDLEPGAHEIELSIKAGKRSAVRILEFCIN
ncbi:MAG: SGNH/GDSL hydrolase family protein [Opitutae bacterium]|jgi:lysophospholipase L1-like esterase|nr:SGNH/GDSL hydrolase family protein [Opitutae bacterium]